MADALISPAVGAAGWLGAAGLATYCGHKLRQDGSERLVPLMGVSAAFVFAAQMVNFAIPGTGSSGHIGGGLLLAALLGPHGALLAIASVLTVQALLFGDGGLLALGCNILNLGLLPCFVAYPVYRVIAGASPSRGRLIAGALVGAVLGLQLGAFAVVLETLLSGKSELPLAGFLLMMQPIHLAIGVGEGLATAAVLLFVWRARPELLEAAGTNRPRADRALVGAFAIAAVLIGGGLSYLASSQPDGLEWSLERTAGTAELSAPSGGVHAFLGTLQGHTALLPEYNDSLSLAGVIGAALTLAVMLGVGLLLRRRRAVG